MQLGKERATLSKLWPKSLLKKSWQKPEVCEPAVIIDGSGAI